jgi:hypothetical protein
MDNENAPGPRPEEDLEYDLAHDARDAVDAAAEPATARPVAVPTETPRYSGGDYSYDLAHDVPRE